MNYSLDQLLQKLPELDARLRTAEFTVSPDRWQSVYDLIYRLNAENRLPDDSERLAQLLAPLFCNNKVEQKSFYALFRHLLQGDFDTRDSEDVVQSSAVANIQKMQYDRQLRQKWPAFGMVFVLIVLFALVIFFNTRPPVVEDQPLQESTLQTIATQERGNATAEPPVAKENLQAIPPRQPPEAVSLDAERRSDITFAYYLLLSLPIVFLLAWLLKLWWRKQVVLSFHQSRQANPLMYLRLRRHKSLPFGWGEFSQRLKRGGSVQTRKLDIARTIDKTIHNGGLFTPVMHTRDPQPAYLVLVNRSNSHDHTADRAHTLIERLQEANVTVYQFEYHNDPQLCFSTGQIRKSYSLTQLARHYTGCRLILIGEGEALLDPFSGVIQRWVQLFNVWETRVLLTPARQPWDARESQIAHSGFAVAPFQVNGLEAISDWLLRPSIDAVVWFTQAGSDSYPDLFALDEDEWLSSTPPQDYDAQQTCTTLYEYLGQSGYRLLAACAVYPQLVSILTITLDQMLFPSDNGSQREQRLVLLSRLPWFREGRMPDYLRRDLLQRLAPQVIERINIAYRQIFARVSESPGSQGASLPFIARASGIKSYLHDLIRFAPADSPMADSLFADVMFSGKTNLLDFMLPRKLANWLPGKRYRLWPMLLAGVSCVVLVAALHFGWLWTAPLLEAEMIQRMKVGNAAITIELSSNEDTRALGDALTVSLEEWGFNLAARRFVNSPEIILSPNERNDLIGAALTPERISSLVEEAISNLNRALDSNLLPLGTELRNITSRLDLNSALTRILASQEIDLLSESGINRALAQGVEDWVNEIADNTARYLQQKFSIQTKAETTKMLSFFVKVATKKQASPEDINAEIQRISSVIRDQLPVLVTEYLSEITIEIVLQAQSRLNEKRKLAGEAESAIPDAIIYQPGYEAAAKVVNQRLSYLSYGGNEYSLIQSETLGLQQESGSVQVSINLRQAIAAEGVFREQLGSADGHNIFQDGLSSGGSSPQMVVVPAGSFLMGSPEAEQGRLNVEGPQHKVSITSFALGKYEVTFDEYDRFAEASGRDKPQDEGWGRGKRPVINVNWEDARAYAAWLSEQTGYNYRLPTEAEWEYAARAGTTTPFSTGECISTDQANYSGNYDYAGCGAKSGVYREKTIVVGSFKANAFGLHDMHGNVWEWTADCWHDSYTGAPQDGSTWQDGGNCARRVVRGGGRGSEPGNLRSANRLRFNTDGAFNYLGFRLARTL